MSAHKLKKTYFRPAFWLRNHHLQSLLATLKFRRKALLKKSDRLLKDCQEVIIECPNNVKLQSFYSANKKPNGALVILIHGWEGSSDSLYILSAAQKIYAQGYDVVRLNLRDHGDSHHLNQELFHSCRLDEIINAVKIIQQTYQPKQLFLCGFSLGGNFALRVAKHAQKHGIALEKAIAICPAVNPIDILVQLETGLSIYNKYFLYKWKRSLKKKQLLFPEDYDFEPVLKMKSMRHMTEALIKEFGHFEHIDDYFNGYALLGSFFADLKTECALLMAEDDPIISISDLERVAPQKRLQIYTSQFGGHCGFIKNRALESWADDFILQQLKAPTNSNRKNAATNL